MRKVWQSRESNVHGDVAALEQWIVAQLLDDGRVGQAAPCIATRYNFDVIKTFQHTGLEKFFLKGTKAGIQPAHANKLRRQLAHLDEASTPRDMDIPGWRLHPLSGKLKDHWSVWVDGNWRLTFRFEGQDAILVDYQDYH